MSAPRRVTLLSHGPNCLDGLTCAVVAARYFADRRFEAMFVSNRGIDEKIQGFSPRHPEHEELWITDISWQESETSKHLNALAARGLELYWVDHHKSAIEARERGALAVDFTDYVLDDSYAASRLLYNYLCERTASQGLSRPGLLALANLVRLADDVDRWLLEVEGSRELALTVRAMSQEDAYRALLAIDSNITYGPELERARKRVAAGLEATFRCADATRSVVELPSLGLTVVSAECEGYTGEVAERWRAEYPRAVFALYDRLSDAVSFRRGENCDVDLSRLAAHFGGGGHEAAAGCESPVPPENRPARIAALIADTLSLHYS